MTSLSQHNRSIKSIILDDFRYVNLMTMIGSDNVSTLKQQNIIEKIKMISSGYITILVTIFKM